MGLFSDVDARAFVIYVLKGDGWVSEGCAVVMPCGARFFPVHVRLGELSQGLGDGVSVTAVVVIVCFSSLMRFQMACFASAWIWCWRLRE